MRRATRPLIVALGVAMVLAGCGRPHTMVPDDLDQLAASPPGMRVNYGADPLQFGELLLPEGRGPHAVVILIHGGCWLAAYDMAHTHALAQALAADGVAVWNLEYRRVGDDGGGWPGTFEDVATGADHLSALAAEHPLDLDRVVAMGHSAGGHLALWLAARPHIATDSALYTAAPLTISGVLALAPAPQLAELHEQEVCGHVVDKLMGGSPQDYPERYRSGNPSEMAPLGVPQIIITGKYDEFWSVGGRAYVDAVRAAGEADVQLIEAPRSGHFEVVNPRSSTWRVVRRALRRLLANQARAQG